MVDLVEFDTDLKFLGRFWNFDIFQNFENIERPTALQSKNLKNEKLDKNALLDAYIESCARIFVIM